MSTDTSAAVDPVKPEDYIRLARRFAANHREWAYCRGLTVDDMLGEAMIAICEAAPKYDPACGYSFWRAAHFAVRNRLATMRRKWRWLQQLPTSGEDGEIELEPADPHEPAQGDRIDVAYLLARLSPRTRAIVVMRFGLDGEGTRQLDELAAHFGVSKERVRQLLHDGLKTLRRYAEVEDAAASA